MIFAIMYKINTSKKDYSSLYEKIKSLGSWMHYLDEGWIIEPRSLDNAKDIYDQLVPFIDGDKDYLFVTQITANNYGWLPQKAWDWFKERRF